MYESIDYNRWPQITDCNWWGKQWNLLPSDIHHIQSSHALKTVLKTHLYKWYKLFQNLSCCLPCLPSLTPWLCYIPSVCVCVFTHVSGNTILWLYIIFEVSMYALCIIADLVVWCTHPCWWDNAVKRAMEMTTIIIIMWTLIVIEPSVAHYTHVLQYRHNTTFTIYTNSCKMKCDTPS